MGNESEEGEETRRAMSRRKLLGLAAAAAAGLALTPLTERAHAATGEFLIVGKHNWANDGDRTLLDGKVDEFPEDPDFPAIFVVSNTGLGQAIVGKSKGGPGIGVQGLSASGIGVLGESPPGMPPPDIDIPVGVHGRSSDGIGVLAISETGAALKVEGKGLVGATVDSDPEGYPGHFPVLHVENHGTGGGIFAEAAGVGVLAHGEHEGAHGFSHSGAGLRGKSFTGIGVSGVAVKSGVGVQGASDTGIGVNATTYGNGIALKVEGISQCYAKVDSADVPKDELPIAFSVFNDGEPAAPEVNPKPPVAIVGNCPHGMGVTGFSEDNAAVHGNSTNNRGVDGFSQHDVGVCGWTIYGQIGVLGSSDNPNGIGVMGRSEGGVGVQGESETGGGVFGSSKNGDGVGGWGGAKGVNGQSAEGIGVYGQSETGFGVFGTQYPQSEDFSAWYSDPSRGLCGLLGYSKTGKGVVGFSDTGIGVLAISKGSPALRVEGKSSFSTVGSGTIPAFKKSYTVNVPAGLITDKSHISVTLTSDPNVIRENAAVSFVERDPANNRFTINLTKAVGQNTTFTYFIVEP